MAPTATAPKKKTVKERDTSTASSTASNGSSGNVNNMTAASEPQQQAETSSSNTTSSNHQFLQDAAWLGGVIYIAYILVNAAYRIRLLAIQEYGPVIHEFDPYFNWRATEVRVEQGRSA
jgi:dolichyl-diphosphooligosaccharide---protein glycosyltransferase